jgi:hypothetical protein
VGKAVKLKRASISESILTKEDVKKATSTAAGSKNKSDVYDRVFGDKRGW